MSVEITFRIELQHSRVKRTINDNEFIFFVTCRLHAVQGRATGIHD